MSLLLKLLLLRGELPLALGMGRKHTLAFRFSNLMRDGRVGREIPRPETHGSDREGEAGRLAFFPALLDRSRRDRDAHGEGRARPRKIDCMPDLRSCPSPCVIPAPLNVVLLKAQAVDAHVRADFPHGDADAVHENLSRIPVGQREIAVGNHARQLVTVRRDGHGLAILLRERRGCGRDDEHRSNEACCSQTRNLSCTVAEHFRSPFHAVVGNPQRGCRNLRHEMQPHFVHRVRHFGRWGGFR